MMHRRHPSSGLSMLLDTKTVFLPPEDSPTSRDLAPTPKAKVLSSVRRNTEIPIIQQPQKTRLSARNRNPSNINITTVQEWMRTLSKRQEFKKAHQQSLLTERRRQTALAEWIRDSCPSCNCSNAEFPGIHVKSSTCVK